jgi:hypothetical protein
MGILPTLLLLNWTPGKSVLFDDKSGKFRTCVTTQIHPKPMLWECYPTLQASARIFDNLARKLHKKATTKEKEKVREDQTFLQFGRSY